MISKRLFEMRKKAKEELKYIYRGEVYQNMLREYYYNLRMASLGKKADKEKYPDSKNRILKMSIEMIKKWAKESKIDFKPNYDRNFFKIS